MNKKMLGMHAVIEYPDNIRIVRTDIGFRVEIIEDKPEDISGAKELLAELIMKDDNLDLEEAIANIQNWARRQPEAMIDWVEGIELVEHLQWKITVEKFCKMIGLKY